MDQLQVIGQAEIFPAIVAKCTWYRQLSGRRVMFYIANESARIALVKQYSPVVPSLELLMKSSALDAEQRISGWYARVPTHSNPADDPSRQRDAELLAAGSMAVACTFPDGSRHNFQRMAGVDRGSLR